jgi:chemotaxis protein CheC
MNPPGSPLLNALELDALGELVNYGVSRAATALREMVGEQVHLSVPNARIVTRPQAIEILRQHEQRGLVAVHQTFEGALNGRALLIFPDANSLELVRAVTGGELPLEDIIELEQEALAETGNVILNSCLATIANMLHRTFKMSLPEILRGEGPEFFNLPPAPKDGDMVMFLYINFSVRERNIRGYIAMLMDMPSVMALKQLLNEFIERTAGVLEPHSDGPY